jgi:Uma2 family endonuclease
MTALILNLRPTIELTDEQFFQLCQNNRDLRLERTAEGELIIMPPTGWICPRLGTDFELGDLRNHQQ